MIYYSKSHKTFFDDTIHGERPSDAQAITQEQHAKLLDALNRGHQIDDDLTIHERPSAAHEWVKGKWVLNQSMAAAEFEQAKRDKLLALNQSAQDYINAVAGIDLLPDFEVRTWTLQALEAKAWAADPNAPTPTLDTISAARSIPADLLKQKALEKALAFEQLTATVVGFRQAIESQIKQAADMDELAAIEFAFGGH